MASIRETIVAIMVHTRNIITLPYENIIKINQKLKWKSPPWLFTLQIVRKQNNKNMEMELELPNTLNSGS